MWGGSSGVPSRYVNLIIQNIMLLEMYAALTKR
jgi:hypothetical protein